MKVYAIVKTFKYENDKIVSNIFTSLKVAKMELLNYDNQHEIECFNLIVGDKNDNNTFI